MVSGLAARRSGATQLRARRFVTIAMVDWLQCRRRWRKGGVCAPLKDARRGDQAMARQRVDTRALCPCDMRGDALGMQLGLRLDWACQVDALATPPGRHRDARPQCGAHSALIVAHCLPSPGRFRPRHVPGRCAAPRRTVACIAAGRAGWHEGQGFFVGTPSSLPALVPAIRPFIAHAGAFRKEPQQEFVLSTREVFAARCSIQGA